MPKGPNKSPRKAAKYDHVVIADLKHTRVGKHHELMEGIFDELETLNPGSALKIPLDGTGEVSLENLRSAIHRSATQKKFRVGTLADDKNFYVWKHPCSDGE
jgi:hypothetical protein